jgi:hypothetical protein
VICFNQGGDYWVAILEPIFYDLSFTKALLFELEEEKMTTDIFFNLVCVTMIASLFGLVLVFAGYKLFRILLPLWGFFFGFLLGAQSVQALFSVGFLTTITSWVAGFIVGLIFAVLAYPFYLFAVGLFAASLGYLVAVAFLLWIGMSYGLLLWLIAVVVAVALAAATLYFETKVGAHHWLSDIGRWRGRWSDHPLVQTSCSIFRESGKGDAPGVPMVADLIPCTGHHR